MKLSLNNRGVGILPLVTGISIASVLTVAFISQMGLDSFRRSAMAYTEWETNLGNQTALSLGGFFVAHNLILCREDGWKDLGKDAKCRWGGSYHTPAIDYSKFNIKSIAQEDSNLVLTILNSDDGKRSYETKLKISLVDWSKDAAFRGMIGELPLGNALADNDRFMVLMNASTDMMLPDKRTKTLVKNGAIRRPIPTPHIETRFSDGRESCIFECEAGDVNTPYPECRGPLAPAPDGGDAAIGIRVTNRGPGAIYRLVYDRVTTFNQDIYPGRTAESTIVDVLPNTEVFMPGAPLDSEIVRKCYPPIVNTNTQTIESMTTGNAGSTTTVTQSTSFRSLSLEKFQLSVSLFAPLLAADPNFVKQYDPYNEATYTKNPSKSILEPRRLGSELQEMEVVSPQTTTTVTTVTTVIRPRVVDQQRSSDGDGDGDN